MDALIPDNLYTIVNTITVSIPVGGTTSLEAPILPAATAANPYLAAALRHPIDLSQMMKFQGSGVSQENTEQVHRVTQADLVHQIANASQNAVFVEYEYWTPRRDISFDVVNPSNYIDVLSYYSWCWTSGDESGVDYSNTASVGPFKNNKWCATMKALTTTKRFQLACGESKTISFRGKPFIMGPNTWEISPFSVDFQNTYLILRGSVFCFIRFHGVLTHDQNSAGNLIFSGCRLMVRCTRHYRHKGMTWNDKPQNFFGTHETSGTQNFQITQPVSSGVATATPYY